MIIPSRVSPARTRTSPGAKRTTSPNGTSRSISVGSSGKYICSRRVFSTGGVYSDMAPILAGFALAELNRVRRARSWQGVPTDTLVSRGRYKLDDVEEWECSNEHANTSELQA